jgi:hypothetical protein
MGAAGSTAKQIVSALYLPPDKDDIKEGFAAILGSLKVRKDSIDKKGQLDRWTCC